MIVDPPAKVASQHYRADCAAGARRRFFDLRHWRVVLVDQRACGASTPRGCLTDNTTQVQIVVSPLVVAVAHAHVLWSHHSFPTRPAAT